ncbi:hypothetical protein [Methanoculleus horonobensis]|uniref:hypothetical protein n=1 Tax=Methanoculleus horonobensis TaxID=528314 RepID=UPI0008317F1D|nr:hypothetical protein [Methanoculleus horonobensis]
MSRLSDALLVRDAWMGAGYRERKYDGQTYLAVSVWADEEDAKEAAAAIRAQGHPARATREIRPRRARQVLLKPTIYSNQPERRYMWVVWEVEPAHAGQNTEETPA